MTQFTQVRLISPAAASKLLAGPTRAVAVDATWYMPNHPKNAHEQFTAEDRIRGAIFFDLDKVCCHKSKYPHMLPPLRVFNDAMTAMNISAADEVVVYDRLGVFSGPRAAWTFALFGHKNVYLLDRYQQFRSEFPADVDTRKYQPLGEGSGPEYEGLSQDQFFHNYRREVIEFDELADLVTSGALTESYHVFDARSKGRFEGLDPEPRPGLPSGHVPGALSLPFGSVLDENGHYKSREELVALFKAEFGLDLTKPLDKDIIVMCGTGVTAVILKVAIGKIDPAIPVRVYDGSWTEWAQRAPNLVDIGTN